MFEPDDALYLEARNKIYKLVEKNPGLHFREIQRRSNLATGSLQYHLDFLQKRHLIKSLQDGKFVRYYSVRKRVKEEDEKVISLLRQDSVRKIILFLLTNKRANNAAISRSIKLSPSTCTFHLKKLTKADVIEKRQRGRKAFFYVKNPSQTAQLLVGYRKSFLDEMVDSFVELWEGFE